MAKNTEMGKRVRYGGRITAKSWLTAIATIEPDARFFWTI